MITFKRRRIFLAINLIVLLCLIQTNQVSSKGDKGKKVPTTEKPEAKDDDKSSSDVAKSDDDWKTDKNKKKSFPAGNVFLGKSCDRNFLLTANSNEAPQTFVIRGDYLAEPAELAFECMLVAKLARGGDDSDSVQISCEAMPIAKPGKGDCPAYYEVNRGTTKHCNKGKLEGVFTPRDGRVVVTAVSDPQASNQFKGGVPSYQCSFKRVPGDEAAKGFPPKPRINSIAIPGFYNAEKCNEDITLTVEDDLYVLEGPLQPFPGRSFMDCKKTIKVPEGYHLMVKCSKHRIIESRELFLAECKAFFQISGGEKICYPHAFQGIQDPKDGKLELRIFTEAFSGGKFHVAKPLFECRLGILPGRTMKGYIIRINDIAKASKSTEVEMMDDRDRKQGKKHQKMDKAEFQHHMVARESLVNGIDGCGGKVNLAKWGYTFLLEPTNTTASKTNINMDCTYTFEFQAMPSRDDVLPMAQITCTDLNLDKNDKCQGFFEVNNMDKYCGKENVLVGMFPSVNGQVRLRVFSADGINFVPDMPLYTCTVEALYLMSDRLQVDPDPIYSGDAKKSVTASTSGRDPTYVLGEMVKASEAKSFEVTITITVPTTQSSGGFSRKLFVNCPRPHLEKVKDSCDFSYTIGKTKVCATTQLLGIFPVDQDTVELLISSKGATFMGGFPTYSCKVFVYDGVDIDENTRLGEPSVVGSSASAGSRRKKRDVKEVSGGALFRTNAYGLGSVADIKDMPLGLLPTVTLSDLAEHAGKMSGATLGQFGSLAALGQLGHMGGLDIGQMVWMDVIGSLPTGLFGSLGDIPLSKIASKKSGLGVLGKLTLGQLTTLARVGMLQHTSLGHVAKSLPMTSSLHSDARNVQQDAKLIEGSSGPSKDRRKRDVTSTSDSLSTYVLHLPQVDRVYDIIALVHQLQISTAQLRELGGSGDDVTYPPDVKKRVVKIKANMNNIVNTIIEMIDRLDGGDETMVLDGVVVNELTVYQLDDLATVVLAIVKKQIAAMVKSKDIIKKVPRVYLYVLNRMLLGTIGATKVLLGSSLEPLLEKFAETICKSKDDIMKLTKKASDVVEALKKASAEASKTSAESSKPADEPAEGEPKPKKRTKWTKKKTKREAEDGEKGVTSPAKDSLSGTESVKDFSTQEAELYVLEQLLGSPFNPHARNFLWKSIEKKQGKKATMTKEEHCSEVVAGKPGGALDDATLVKLTDILANELTGDVAMVTKEMNLMDSSRKLRVVRIYVGLQGAVLRTLGGFLDSMDKGLQLMTDRMVQGLDSIMLCSPYAYALSLGGTLFPMMLSMGSTSTELTGRRDSAIEHMVRPLSKAFGWPLQSVSQDSLTGPVLEVLGSLNERFGSFTVMALRHFLYALTRRVSATLTALRDSILPHMDDSHMIATAEILGGGFHAFVTKAQVSESSLLAVVVGYSKLMGEKRLLEVSKSVMEAGTPPLLADHGYNGSGDDIKQIEENIVQDPTDKLGESLVKLLELEYLAKKFNKQSKSLDERRKREAAGGDRESAKGGSGLKSLNSDQLRQLVRMTADQFEKLLVAIESMSSTDEVSLAQVMDLIEANFGLMAATGVEVSYDWVKDKEASADVQDNRYGKAVQFNINIARTNLYSLVDIEQMEESQADSLDANMQASATSGGGYTEAMRKVAIAIFRQTNETSPDGKTDIKTPTSAIAASLASAIDGTTIRYFDFGHKKCSITTILPGSLGALARDMKGLKGQEANALSTRERQAAYKRRRALKSLKPRDGLVVIGVDDGTSHFSNFYDDDDIADEAKEALLDKVMAVMLTLPVHDQLVALSTGESSQPVTVEVQVTGEMLGCTKDCGPPKKISVTLGRAGAEGGSGQERTHNSPAEDAEEVSRAVYSPNFGDQSSADGMDNEIDDDSGKSRESPMSRKQSRQKSTSVDCKTWRESALSKKVSDSDTFIPKCKPSGDFDALQCDSTGLCWCVYGDGSQIPGSMNFEHAPDCGMYAGSAPQDGEKLYIGPDNVVPLGSDETETTQIKNFDATKLDQNCGVAKQNALKQKSSSIVSAAGVFIPSCEADGSYSPQQCASSKKNCWCVTKDGREIPGTGTLDGADGKADCKGLQSRHGGNKADIGPGWDYLWLIARKWQIKVKHELRKKSKSEYRPKGALVRLTAASGFSNSVMFVAQEPAGPGLPTPYEVWRSLMSKEVRDFKEADFIVQNNELNKLDKVQVPDGKGGTQSVAVAAILKTFPMTRRIYDANARSPKRFQEAINSMDLDWSKLSAADNQADPSGSGKGHLGMTGAKKFCFCKGDPAKAGKVVDAGKLPGESGGDPSGSRAPGGRKDGSPSTSGGLWGSAGAPGDRRVGESSGFLNSIVDFNPIRSMLSASAALLMPGAKEMKYSDIGVRLSFLDEDFWDKLGELTGTSTAEMAQEFKVNFTMMYSKPIARIIDPDPNCLDESIVAVEDVSDGRRADDKINLGALLEFFGKHGVTLDMLLMCAGVDLLPFLGSQEKALAKMITVPLSFFRSLMTRGIAGAWLDLQFQINQSGGVWNLILTMLGSEETNDPLAANMLDPLGILLVGQEFLFTFWRAFWGTCYTIIWDLTEPLRIVWYWLDWGQYVTDTHAMDIFGFRPNVNMTASLPKGHYGPLDTRSNVFYPGFGSTVNAFGFFFTADVTAWPGMILELIDLMSTWLGPQFQAVVVIFTGIIRFSLKAVFGDVGKAFEIFANLNWFDCIMFMPQLIIALTGNIFVPFFEVIMPFMSAIRFMIYGDFALSLKISVEVGHKVEASVGSPPSPSGKSKKLISDTPQVAKNGPAKVKPGAAKMKNLADTSTKAPGGEEATTSAPATTEATTNAPDSSSEGEGDIKSDYDYPRNGTDPGSSPLATTKDDKDVAGEEKPSDKKLEPGSSISRPEKALKGKKIESATKTSKSKGKRPKRSTGEDGKGKKSAENDPEVDDKISSMLNGGYKEDDSTLRGRMFAAPQMLVKAGGGVFTPIVGGLHAIIATVMNFVEGSDDIWIKIVKVPKIWKASVGFVRPFADIVEAFVPLILAIRDVTRNTKGYIQFAMELPQLLAQMTTGAIGQTIAMPGKLWEEFTGSFTGLQSEMDKAKNLRPSSKPGLMQKHQKDLDGYGKKPTEGTLGFVPDYGNFVFSGILPAIELARSLTNGVLGNVLSPQAMVAAKTIDYDKDPFGQVIKKLMAPIELYRLANDGEAFLKAALGGQDPATLLAIGIDADEILKQEIDPARFLTGGLKMVPKTKRERLGTVDSPNSAELKKLKFDETKLKLVDLDFKKILSGGLLEAVPSKLMDHGIDPFNMINRLLRNSIINKTKLMLLGINFKKLLSAGIMPDFLFASGITVFEADLLKDAGIDPNNLDDLKQFEKIGFSASKFKGKGVDLKEFMATGIEDMSKSFVAEKIGIHAPKLLGAVYCGFDQQKMANIGLNLAKMFRAGITPAMWVTGSANIATNDPEKLREKGIDTESMKKSGLEPDVLLKDGLTLANPQMFTKMGIDTDKLTAGLMSQLGLEVLVGGEVSDDVPCPIISTIFATITSIWSLVGSNSAIGRTINSIPVLGPLFFNVQGNMVGPLRYILVDLLGVTGKDGVMGWVKAVLNGRVTVWSALKLLNPTTLFHILFKGLRPDKVLNPYGELPYYDDQSDAGFMNSVMGGDSSEMELAGKSDSEKKEIKQKQREEADEDAWGRR